MTPEQAAAVNRSRRAQRESETLLLRPVSPVWMSLRDRPIRSPAFVRRRRSARLSSGEAGLADLGERRAPAAIDRDSANLPAKARSGPVRPGAADWSKRGERAGRRAGHRLVVSPPGQGWPLGCGDGAVCRWRTAPGRRRLHRALSARRNLFWRVCLLGSGHSAHGVSPAHVPRGRLHSRARAIRGQRVQRAGLPAERAEARRRSAGPEPGCGNVLPRDGDAGAL